MARATVPSYSTYLEVLAPAYPPLLSYYEKCCIAATSVDPNNPYTQPTFAEAGALFAELCENAPVLIPSRKRSLQALKL